MEHDDYESGLEEKESPVPKKLKVVLPPPMIDFKKAEKPKLLPDAFRTYNRVPVPESLKPPSTAPVQITKSPLIPPQVKQKKPNVNIEDSSSWTKSKHSDT